MADLTGGPIARSLLAFALPTLFSNLLQSLVQTINTIWVGQFLGEGAVAATANGNIVSFLLFSSVFGFGLAAMVLVGQAAGRRDIASARIAFGGALGFCGLLSLGVAGAGWIASPAILHALGTPDSIFDLALPYLRITFVGMPVSMLSTIVMVALRGVGDSMTPLRFMAVNVVLAIALNPLLIQGFGPLPPLGIAGSALSSAIAGLVSLIAMLVHIYRRDLPLRLRGHELGHLWPGWPELRFILTKGVPMGAQMLMMAGSGIALITLVNREGMAMGAAYGAVLQLWSYIQMPSFAVSAAVSAMAAQNIGANLWHRVDRITMSGIIGNSAVTGAMLAVVLLFDRPLLGLFLGDAGAALELGEHILLISTWALLLFGVTIILLGTLRANGVVGISLAILGLCLFPVRLGFYALAYDWLGADAIWWSFPICFVTSVILAALVYRHGGWRRQRIAPRAA